MNRNSVLKLIKNTKSEPKKLLSFQVGKVPTYLYKKTKNGGGDRDNAHRKACQRATSKVPTYNYIILSLLLRTKRH